MIIDPSGRGPTMRQLLVAGTIGCLVFLAGLWLLMLRYGGDFTPKTTVVANLTTTGDGLPQKADVKFRGIFVGSVDSVDVAALGENQRVTISMKPEYVSGVPNTVTARVVPSNVFAVTAIELIDNGPGPGLREGAQIQQDKSQGTVALQSTLTTVRSVLDKIDPTKLGRILTTLSDALDGSGRVPGSTIERLDHWITTVRASVPDFGGDLDNFAAAAHALNQSTPELVDTLSRSVKVAGTISQRRASLIQLLVGSGSTVDSVNTLFARNPDVGKEVVGGLNQTFGALAKDAGAIPESVGSLNTSLRKLDSTFRWGPSGLMVWSAGVSFSPFTPYARADCPRYGSLAGPSCGYAPITADPGYLPPSMQPHSLTGAPAPLIGLPGALVPKAAPAPGGAPQAPGTPPAQLAPARPFAGTPLEGLFPAPPAPAPQPAHATGGEHR